MSAMRKLIVDRVGLQKMGVLVSNWRRHTALYMTERFDDDDDDDEKIIL